MVTLMLKYIVLAEYTAIDLCILLDNRSVWLGNDNAPHVMFDGMAECKTHHRQGFAAASGNRKSENTRRILCTIPAIVKNPTSNPIQLPLRRIKTLKLSFESTEKNIHRFL